MTILLLVPALVPRHDTFQRLLVSVLLTLLAYFLQRLWDQKITGRPLPRGRRTPPLVPDAGHELGGVNFHPPSPGLWRTEVRSVWVPGR